MLTQELRRKFLNYFKEKGHTVLPSSPVVPHDDPTLLFTNAGMNQFKDVFLGKSQRDYKRAATSQKCVRVGGKHNDLENVGHTSRHLTFFEMLGNFSFGDYFKEQAIQYAWEVATQVIGFDPSKIWPSVFREDDEAFQIWTKYVPAERIVRMDEKDNFWAMGDTGPCGPCSELYFDKGPAFGKGRSPKEDETGERFLEFWNLVFMQYNRQPDGTLLPLPKPSIDTGAGIERILSLQMGVESVFETDVLRALIQEIETLSNIRYTGSSGKTDPAFRVIADHLRCLAFAIADGVQPSNVDRGYVLRKVLRRAVRYGRSLGLDKPFLAQLFPILLAKMGEDYKELPTAQARICEILTQEEEAFIRTLRRGGNILNTIIEEAQKQDKVICGDDAFKLKDTYGFPLEEITLLAKDAGLTVDTTRYHVLENEAKERSRSVHKTTQQIAKENLFASFLEKHSPCQFTGYQQTSGKSNVLALISNGQFTEQLEEGQEGMVILDQTPFYAEMGGQVGDTGTLAAPQVQFTILDTQQPYKDVIAHVGKLEKGNLKIGDALTATVNAERRQKIANNHTATHLLHWALHKVLGEHVKQAGSVVDPDRLRFDFSHHKALSPKEIETIEDLVNGKIRENLPVSTYEISYDQAQKNHEIKQFFGEKYGSTVRVIDIDYSKELCGGTHTSRVGNIGLFRIAKESSIAAGVRRIEAITGAEAEALARGSDQTIATLANALKTQPAQLVERLQKLLEENKELATELKTAKQAQLKELATQLRSQITHVHNKPLVAAVLNVSPDELKVVAEEIVIGAKSCVVVLGATAADKCHLFIRVSDDLVSQGVNGSQLIKELATVIEGTGGGKPNSAQAGGKAPHRLAEALERAKGLL